MFSSDRRGGARAQLALQMGTATVVMRDPEEPERGKVDTMQVELKNNLRQGQAYASETHLRYVYELYSIFGQHYA